MGDINGFFFKLCYFSLKSANHLYHFTYNIFVYKIEILKYKKDHVVL